MSPRRQRVHHHGADQRDDDGVKHGAAAQDPVERLLPLQTPLDVDVGVVSDQARRTADFCHHCVAGIDAKAALDAAEIGAAADIDAGRTDIDALQAIDAIARRLAVLVQRRGLLQRRARFAAIVPIGDVERILVGQCRLNARPWTHVDADLFAHPTGQRVGREREHGDEDIGDKRRLKCRKVSDQGRRVGEIEHPGAAGPPRHHQPQKMLQAGTRQPIERPRLAVALQMLAAIAFGPPLDGEKEIGPYGLRAQISAPHPAGDGVHQEQDHGRDNEQPGEVVGFLRPNLDEEEIKASPRQIDQHRLVRRVRPAIPAHERQQVIDAERDDQHRPFYSAVRPRHVLRIDFPARRIERCVVIVGFVKMRRRRDRPQSASPRRRAWRAATAPAATGSQPSMASAMSLPGHIRHFSPPPNVCT